MLINSVAPPLKEGQWARQEKPDRTKTQAG